MGGPVPATLIGASGYVGRALHQALRRQGRTVLAPAHGQERDVLGTGDIGDLFYCAGLTADFAAQPAATAEAHVALLARLLERCRPRRVVYLSSTRLFDSQGPRPVDDSTALLLNPLEPRHLYDLTKATGEALCLAMLGDRARIARLSCVWSADADAPGFLPELLQRLRTLRASTQEQRHPPLLRLDSQPGSARHYIHRSDLVEALIQLAALEEHPPITSLASEEQACTNAELAACLEDLFGCTIEFSMPSSAARSAPRLDLSHYARLPLARPLPLLDHLRHLHDALTP